MDASGTPPGQSPADLLHPDLLRWCWHQGWTGLRPIQEDAIRAIGCEPSTRAPDAVLSAATAGGKTEAAFLPILSRVLRDREAGVARPGRPPAGFDVLCVSPLKALINDQAERLRDMAGAAGIETVAWHGDADRGAKARAMRRPSGILLITPESLEAMLALRAREIPRLFGRLAFVVVDELHAFIGTERGRQLQSILHRVDTAAGVRPARIGLSATLADLRMAAEFLRPGGGGEAALLEAGGDGRTLLLAVKGVLEEDREEGRGGPSSLDRVVDDAFRRLRGRRNLLFAGSRALTELMTDALARRSAQDGVPNEFLAHHGNLSKATREQAERAMKSGTLPTTIVCTSTLEMGIDIGGIESIGQVGPAVSVAAMRQRLGRSGRRGGKPAILRIWVPAYPLKASAHPVDRLRMPLVRAAAMCELMLEGWTEPPRPEALHLSTLLHQTLSVICERHGIRPDALHELLCKTGPFRTVSPRAFKSLLLDMKAHKLLEQAPDGDLLLGEAGEAIVKDKSFFAVFKTPVDWQVMHNGRRIGAIPAEEQVMAPGMSIILAGRRWRITEVDMRTNEVSVVPGKEGKPPKFSGEPGAVHVEIARRMRALYLRNDVPAFLDPGGAAMLAEGRDHFRGYGLDRVRAVAWKDGAVLFPWTGTAEVMTLALRLVNERGVPCAPIGLAIETEEHGPEAAEIALDAVLTAPRFDLVELARRAGDKVKEKYDGFLGDELLARNYAASRLADVRPNEIPESASSLADTFGLHGSLPSIEEPLVIDDTSRHERHDS